MSSGFELSPSADYVEIVERPLFNPTRKPAPPDEAKPGSGAGAEETAATQIALNGIVLVGNRRVALLRFDNDPKVMHVAEGQQAGGWRIEKITADRVTLRRGQQENQVVLDYKRRGGNEQAGAPVPSPTNGEMTGTVPRDDEAVE
ncbi:MAG TPA: hypothetical protein VES39_11600 [Rhodospirillales bacterium]|nr:hypothetical protein [Rhodospirillales bacterium]